MGEWGNKGMGESGNGGMEEWGNWGMGELGNWGMISKIEIRKIYIGLGWNKTKTHEKTVPGR